MWGAEWADGHQGLAWLQKTHGAIDASGLQALGGGQWGKDGRQAFGKECFARPRRTDHQDVVVKKTRFWHHGYSEVTAMAKAIKATSKAYSCRAYSYLRFSSSKQGDGDSLRRQTVLRDAYCQKHGLILDETLDLNDLGVSGFTGANAKTGALSRFLRAIEDGLVERGSVLIIENLDRLSREQVLDALHIFRQIVKAGVKVVTLKPEREYTAENIGDDFTILEAIFDMMRAHRESKRKSDLGSAAWTNKRNKIKAKPLTARIPAWLRVVDGRFKDIAEHVEIIRQIFRLAIDGHGQTAIMKRLNAQGKFIGRVQRWNKSYVAKILTNRAVLGEFQPHTGSPGDRKPIGEMIPDYYPRIIPDDDFYRAQNGMQARGQRRGRTGKNVANLFTGIVRDATNGSPMSIVHKDTKRLVSGAGIRGERGAKFVSFPYDVFEHGILRWLKEIDPSDLIGSERQEITIKLEASEATLLALETRIRIIQERLTTDADLTPLMDVLATLETQRRELSHDVERLRSEQAAAFDGADVGTLDLIRHLDTVEGDELFILRTNIKSRIRNLIAEMVVAVEHDGPVRRATATVRFRSGLERKILIVVRRGNPAVYHKILPD
jgi:DNA invertase Pin-like site-specific DNA recombinase